MKKWPGSEEPTETAVNHAFDQSLPWYDYLQSMPEKARRYNLAMKLHSGMRGFRWGIQVTRTVHDFFEPQTVVADVYFFRWIFHGFSDKYNIKILRDLCGAELGKLISGAKEPLTVLFGSKKNRDILEDVYSTSPMYVIMSQLLTRFLEKALSGASPGPGGVFRIIELGAGTGSTTK
ncbi:uncharacterized protein QC763_0077990 [Podospora pseudopauciseta]|uniref:Uncharacterized protein n=1 Tax=Podospora pseudopauciseta TaxID=2093780 RepID=A0ABR0HB91_9PEZI|nr:hypothetical protein QC763_0077990 [Podospora pseudopauciseta]